MRHTCYCLYFFSDAGQYTVVAGKGPTARYMLIGGLVDEENTPFRVLVVGKHTFSRFYVEWTW